MTVDERLDRPAANLEILTRRRLDAQRAAEERAAAADERAAEAAMRHDCEMAAIRAALRRGIRLSIQEARAERSKRQKLERAFDEKITQLAAAQPVTEDKLQRFLEHRSGNGKP